MKKPYLLLILIVFSSCATVKTLPELKVINPAEHLYDLDFSPYAAKGFLITPEKYSGEYESIGLITFTAMPGAQYKRIGFKVNPFYTAESGQPKIIDAYEWATDTIEFDTILNKVYNICLSRGADALVNFQGETIYSSYDNYSNPVTLSGYKISGYAIKRKSLNVQLVK